VRSQFDRSVVPDWALEFVRACQQVAPCHLAGGAALSGAWLSHRHSRDIDLFVHDGPAHRQLVSAIASIARSVGLEAVVVRDSGGHVRGRLLGGSSTLELDVVHEALKDLQPPRVIESVVVESPEDLRASKLTCILSRAEPRDLVDLLFLERAGFPPENDLPLALQKDAGIDPGTLAWLLRDFPLEPIPQMISPLTADELRAYRDELSARFKRLAQPKF
jgi:hypothetical protein